MKTNHITLSWLSFLLAATLLVVSEGYAQQVPIPLLQTIRIDYTYYYGFRVGPDGKTFVTEGQKTDPVILWDVQTGRKLMTLPDRSDSLYFCSYSPDGKFIAFIFRDYSCKFWNIKTSRFQNILYAPLKVQSWPHFSDGSKTVTIFHQDNTLVVYDLFASRKLVNFKVASSHAGGIFFLSPDRNILLTAAGNIVEIWDIRAKRLLNSLKSDWNIIHQIFPKWNDRLLATFSYGNGIELWELPSGRKLRTLSEPGDNGRFTPDGTSIIWTGYNVDQSDGKYNTLKQWDVRTGREQQSLKWSMNSVTIIGLSPNCRIVESHDVGGSVTIWDAQTGRKLQSFPSYIEFSPDSRTIAAILPQEQKIKLVDVQTSHELSSLILNASDCSGLLYFSADGKTLFYHGVGWEQGCLKAIKVWDVSLLDSALFKIYLVNQQQKDKELGTLSLLFAAKDEFETNEEYRIRISKANNEKKAIENKYALKIAQLKEDYYEQKQAQLQAGELEIRTKIHESLSEAVLSISNIGTYNANDETFPITINDITEQVKIPRAEARSFKENWQRAEVRGMKQFKNDLTTYESFNLAIIHPVTGNRFPFGEQRDIGQLAVNSPATTSGTSRSVVPPALSMKAKLVEPSGNGFLDAEEKGKIIIDIANSGKGTAYGIIVDVKNETVDPNVTFSRTRVAGEIPAGLTKTVEFEVEAAKVVKRAFQNFVISATESNGFVPNPVKLGFETYPLLLPELSLVDYGITTASGDNIISPGEVVNIKARAQNIGEGKAKNINFVVNLPTNVFFAPESQQRFQVFELNSGAFQDLEFSILTNNKVEKQVNLTIGMSEANTQKSFILPLEIDKPLQSLQEFVVKGKEREKTAIENVATLTVDIAKDIPMTPTKNSEAYAVVIGNRDYLKVKNVDFAINDATLVKEYLIKAFGYRDENIFFIKNATKADFELCFGTKGNYKGKLSNAIRPDGASDVFVFYSGHGSPDVNDQKGYFVPVDADPQYVGVSGYALDLLYENLAQIPAKSVTVVLDACFSGSGLLENISPVRIKFTNALMAIKNGVVLSSSTGDQVSGWYPEKRHGLFTYFFLKAMHNRNADFNKDGLLTFEEIFNYVTDANEGVPRYARKLHNVEQNPTMLGDKSRVWVRY